MDSSGSWLVTKGEPSTPAKNNFSCSPAKSNFRPTTTSPDMVVTNSPQTYLRSPVSSLTLGFNSGVPNGAPSQGRPCVAGTQTNQHTANQPVSKIVNHSYDNNDDTTRDSSGFGSLLVDQSNTSLLSGYSNGSERHSRWQGPALTSLASDTSDLGHSFLEDRNSSVTPLRRSDYPQVAGAARQISLIKEVATTIPEQTKLNSSVTDSHYDDVTSNSISASSRESRILEENLASVARYVEELTGSVSVANSQVNRIVESIPQQRQAATRTVPSPGGLNGSTNRIFEHNLQSQICNLQGFAESQQSKPLTVPSRHQFTPPQQADGRIHDKVQVTQTQDLLLRLLVNQFPDLVLNANSAIFDSVTDNQPAWSSGATVQPATPRTTFAPHKQSNEFIYGNNKINGQLQLGMYNTAATRESGSTVSDPSYMGENCSDQQQSLRNAREFGSLEGKSLPQNIDMPNILQLLPLQNQQNTHSPQHASNSATPVNSSAMVALANLFNLGPKTATGTNPSTSCSDVSPTTNALATLLASLQERVLTPKRLAQLREVNSHNYQPPQECEEHHITSNPSNQSPTTALSEELLRLAVPYQRILGALENDIDRAANVYRNSATTVAQTSEAAYHWSGRLPVRVYRSMTFSRKVFLGGVPWDSTSDDLISAFSRFGNVMVAWPQQEASQISGFRIRTASPKGYCYLIFEHESSVNELLAACVRDPATGGDYYKISSSKFKSKDVQVIPWVTSDSQYTKSGPFRPDSKRTVFIGALHGMITAEALVSIMNDLFGNVIFAALDTDKYKYPIGSGRVAFSSYKSYMRAVTANFVDVRTSKFVKTIQIDPYLEDSLCNNCTTSPGIYFCRAFECFRYFCPACWQLWHNSTQTLYTHKPLRRTFKPVSDRTCCANAPKF